MISHEFIDAGGEGFGAARAPDTARAQARRIHLWDLPLRAFHWLLVLAVAIAVVTGKLGGNWMSIHGKAGLSIVGLVVFRLAWGFVGPTHARFASFFPTPTRLRAYLSGRWQGVGHNPLGAISVFALLGLLAVQAGSGLFSNDDIAYSGPLYPAVSDALSARLSAVHRLSVNGLLGLVGLHVLAIAYHVRVKRDDLLKPMVTGWKEVEHGDSTRGGSPAALATAVLLAVLTAFSVGSTAAPGRTPTAAGIVASKPAW
jgi:cytochrome b